MMPHLGKNRVMHVAQLNRRWTTGVGIWQPGELVYLSNQNLTPLHGAGGTQEPKTNFAQVQLGGHTKNR